MTDKWTKKEYPPMTAMTADERVAAAFEMGVEEALKGKLPKMRWASAAANRLATRIGEGARRSLNGPVGWGRKLTSQVGAAQFVGFWLNANLDDERISDEGRAGAAALRALWNEGERAFGTLCNAFYDAMYAAMPRPPTAEIAEAALHALRDGLPLPDGFKVAKDGTRRTLVFRGRFSLFTWWVKEAGNS
jgi:hypothetical protein